MNRSSSDALQQLTDIQKEIERSLKRMGYNSEEESLEGVSFPQYTDSRDIEFMRGQLTLTIQRLDEIIADIKYLNRPIKTTGWLVRQSNERYQLNDIELSSGMLVEILDDDFEWRLTRIEHNGDLFTVKNVGTDDFDALRVERMGDYYAVALGKSVPIEGRKCRLRF